MSHNTRVRTFGGWAALTTLDDTEMEKFDAQALGAIDGDGGGSWAPTAEITVTGTFGFRSFALKGGPNVSGNPAFQVNPTTGEITNRGLSTFTGASVFNNTGTFNGSTTFNSVATFTDDGVFNSDAIFNQTVSLPTSPGGTTISSASAQPHFEVNPPVAFTDKHIHWRNLTNDTTNPSLWREDISVTGGQTLISNTLGSEAYIQLYLDPNCTYTSFSVVTKGTTHSSFPPAARSRFQILECDTVARTTTTISSFQSDNSVQATYESTHNVVITGMTAFRPVAGKQYYIRCVNENGANAVTGYLLFAVVASGSVSRFGTSMFNPILQWHLQNTNILRHLKKARTRL